MSLCHQVLPHLPFACCYCCNCLPSKFYLLGPCSKIAFVKPFPFPPTVPAFIQAYSFMFLSHGSLFVLRVVQHVLPYISHLSPYGFLPLGCKVLEHCLVIDGCLTDYSKTATCSEHLWCSPSGSWTGHSELQFLFTWASSYSLPT